MFCLFWVGEGGCNGLVDGVCDEWDVWEWIEVSI